jgi:HlyD family secretion protein
VKRLLAPFIILALITGAGCKTKKKTETTKKAKKGIPVKVTTAYSKDMWAKVSAVGTVKPNLMVVVKSKIPGKIIKINVVEGTKIRKDQVLLELDQIDYELAVKNAQAALKAAQFAFDEAKVNLKETEGDWKRFKRLYEKKVIAKQKWDHINAGYHKAKIFMDLTAARVSRAKVALDIALTNLKNTKLTAPFDGIVAKRLVDPGTRVYTMPPTVLLVVMDISRVKIVTDIPEKEMADLHLHAAAKIKFDAFPGKTFTGEITKIYPGIDPVTRNFTAEIELDNPEEKLHAGMFAHVQVKVKKIHGLVIPRSAILKIPGTGVFYTFKVEGNTVKKVNLETGISQDNLVQVLKGLKEGDRVVTVGNTRLRTGTRIEIMEGERAK